MGITQVEKQPLSIKGNLNKICKASLIFSFDKLLYWQDKTWLMLHFGAKSEQNVSVLVMLVLNSMSDD